MASIPKKTCGAIQCLDPSKHTPIANETCVLPMWNNCEENPPPMLTVDSVHNSAALSTPDVTCKTCGDHVGSGLNPQQESPYI